MVAHREAGRAAREKVHHRLYALPRIEDAEHRLSGKKRPDALGKRAVARVEDARCKDHVAMSRLYPRNRGGNPLGEIGRSVLVFAQRNRHDPARRGVDSFGGEPFVDKRSVGCASQKRAIGKRYHLLVAHPARADELGGRLIARKEQRAQTSHEAHKRAAVRHVERSRADAVEHRTRIVHVGKLHVSGDTSDVGVRHRRGKLRLSD